MDEYTRFMVGLVLFFFDGLELDVLSIKFSIVNPETSTDFIAK